MILFGLVLSTVGLDIISGQPRLIFFDMPGFYGGIGFLILAIGVYGVGEVLWTIEETRGKPKVTNAKITFKELWLGLKLLATTTRTMIVGSVMGFFVGVLPAAGRNARGADGLWPCAQQLKAPRAVRQGGD